MLLSVLSACGARTELSVARDAGVDGARLDVVVPRIADGAEISATSSHACVRRENGQVWCWGIRNSGRMGTCDRGVPGTQSTPAPTGVLLNASSVSVSAAHACALQDDGVWCWGYSLEGQLMAVDRSLLCPERLAIERPASVLAVPGGGCVISTDGALSCWGQGDHGELGAGANTEPVLGTTRIPLENVVQVSVAANHGCARVRDGTVYCWGSNEFAQLGFPTGPDQYSPRRVEGLPPATDLSAGHQHTCAIAEGDVWCWGDNGTGDLALGDSSPRNGPVRTLVRRARSLARNNSSCAVHMDGRVSCWSSSSFGVLLADRNEVGPVRIPLPGRATSVDGTTTVCSLLEDGSVWCWGRGSGGQLGNGTTDVLTSLVPLPVLGFP